MEDKQYEKIISKLTEHEVRIKHLEDVYSRILQIQTSVAQMNEKITRIDGKVEALDISVKDLKRENRETMQKLVNAITNGYKEEVKTRAQLRIEKWQAVEKWIIRILMVLNTALLAIIGHGVYHL